MISTHHPHPPIATASGVTARNGDCQRIVIRVILCSHYATVGQTVWQTVARSDHTLRRFDKLSALRVCSSVARSSHVQSHVSNMFDPNVSHCWTDCLSNRRIVWTLCATVWQTRPMCNSCIVWTLRQLDCWPDGLFNCRTSCSHCATVAQTVCPTNSLSNSPVVWTAY